MKDGAVYRMPFSKIYPLLVAKVVRKGRTKEEADAVIRWLTGYSQAELDALAENSEIARRSLKMRRR